MAYTAALRGGCHWSQKVRLRRRLRAAMRTIEMTPQAAPVFHNYDRTPWFIAATRIVAVSLAELLLLPAWYLAADLAVLGVTVRRNVHQVRSIPPKMLRDAASSIPDMLQRDEMAGPNHAALIGLRCEHGRSRTRRRSAGNRRSNRVFASPGRFPDHQRSDRNLVYRMSRVLAGFGGKGDYYHTDIHRIHDVATATRAFQTAARRIPPHSECR